jgi:hypothetical protein
MIMKVVTIHTKVSIRATCCSPGWTMILYTHRRCLEVAPSRLVAPPHDLGRQRAIAEIDARPFIAEGDARDPKPSSVMRIGEPTQTPASPAKHGAIDAVVDRRINPRLAHRCESVRAGVSRTTKRRSETQVPRYWQILLTRKMPFYWDRFGSTWRERKPVSCCDFFCFRWDFCVGKGSPPFSG